MRKTPESIEGSTRAAALSNLPQRDPVYSNPSTLFLSHPLSVPTYLKPPSVYLLSHPRRSILPSRRPSFLTPRRASSPFLFPRTAPPRARTLPPSPYISASHFVPCAPRALLTIDARTHALSVSLPSSGPRTPKANREAATERRCGRGNERANGGAGSLRSCATRTSQPRATVARQPRCPFKGIAR